VAGQGHTPLSTLSHRPVQAVCLDSSLAGHSVNPLLTVLRPNPEIKESGIVVALTAKKGQSRPSFRFRGRSFMAFVLAPELPLHDWMAELDSQLHRSEHFFLRRPVILDLSRVALTRSDLGDFISDLRARDVQIIGVEGVDPSCLGPGLPPLLQGGRPADNAMETVPAHRESAPSNVRQEQSCLLLDSPVRSGQSVFFPSGDVTVIGSIASGAEVIAGGSIHIYGSLRGRAMAGSTGNARARIFCRKVEAELLAIDGLYKTADDIDPSLRGRPVQAWLEGDALKVAAFN
jgi:septum site-determining protein MinC